MRASPAVGKYSGAITRALTNGEGMAAARDVFLTPHARRRMLERDIRIAEVLSVLEHGEIIEDYPDDTPFPSRLLCGWYDRRPLHVVAARDTESGREIIISVYEPDRSRWDASFTRRQP